MLKILYGGFKTVKAIKEASDRELAKDKEIDLWSLNIDNFGELAKVKGIDFGC